MVLIKKGAESLVVDLGRYGTDLIGAKQTRFYSEHMKDLANEVEQNYKSKTGLV